MKICKKWAADQSCVWRDSAEWSPSLGDSVHLWSAPLDRDDSAVLQLLSLLSYEERAHARKYRFENDRRRFIVRRGLLRTILSRYLETKPGALRFRTGECGKLHLSDSRGPTLEFNVTHSHGMALIAVARTCCVGVDLERVQPLPELELMIEECFLPSEARDIHAMPILDRLANFYRYWTCKEASMKALGVGLNRGLNSVRISLTASGVECQAQAVLKDGRQETPTLSVRSFVPFECYVAATATHATCMRHEMFAI